MEADDNKKNSFLENFTEHYEIPQHDIKFLMGNIDPHWSDNITNNDSKQFILFCGLTDIVIGNTFS